jgi:glutamate decarboxylase
VSIMRALVKQTASREHVDTLVRDIKDACTTTVVPRSLIML